MALCSIIMAKSMGGYKSIIMKECPKCGELNAEKNTRCFNCNTYLENVKSTTRICPKCMQVFYDSKVDECPKCRVELRDYSPTYGTNNKPNNKTDIPIWAYIIAIIIPIVGIIIGLVYLSRGEDVIAKRLILISVLVSIVWGVGYYFIMSSII